jgi:hypothetical protein
MNSTNRFPLPFQFTATKEWTFDSWTNIPKYERPCLSISNMRAWANLSTIESHRQIQMTFFVASQIFQRSCDSLDVPEWVYTEFAEVAKKSAYGDVSDKSELIVYAATALTLLSRMCRTADSVEQDLKQLAQVLNCRMPIPDIKMSEIAVQLIKCPDYNRKSRWLKAAILTESTATGQFRNLLNHTFLSHAFCYGLSLFKEILQLRDALGMTMEQVRTAFQPEDKNGVVCKAFDKMFGSEQVDLIPGFAYCRVFDSIYHTEFRKDSNVPLTHFVAAARFQAKGRMEEPQLKCIDLAAWTRGIRMVQEFKPVSK